MATGGEFNREALKEKLRKKRNQRKKHEPTFDENSDLLSMMDQVNKILKTNPQMVQQISKCVSNVMNNQELMESLTGQLKQELNVQDPQTFESKSDDDETEACSKESIQ